MKKKIKKTYFYQKNISDDRAEDLNENLVGHDYSYHAEIRFETVSGFDYCSAVGNTVIELAEDIRNRFKHKSNREPKIVKLIKYPNTKKLEIADWDIEDATIFYKIIKYHLGSLNDIAENV